jgi:hypothetical protein
MMVEGKQKGFRWCLGVKNMRAVYFYALVVLLVTIVQLNYFVLRSHRDLQQHLLTHTPKDYYGQMAADDNKPSFVFHVGPPKTATTTLQLELTNFRETLKEDNYWFLGTSSDDKYDPLMEFLLDRKCMLQVNKLRSQGSYDDMPPCWQSFLTRLEQLHAQNRNIIMSEEWFSIQFAEYEGVGRTSVDWAVLKDALRDWNVLIVVGYRHLFDIMPSAKQQWDRYYPHIKALNDWPPQGRTLQPLFPGVLEDPHLGEDYVPQNSHLQGVKQWSYTDYLLETIGPYFPMKILDIHKEGTVRTNFMCEILPHAPRSCSLSIRRDRETPETRSNAEQSLFYDALVTAAAAKGWIRTERHTRRATALQLRAHWEDTLQHKPQDLEQICPPDHELEILLAKSLAKERKIMPHLSEDDHRKAFEVAKKKKKFCWVDTERALAQPEVSTFFFTMLHRRD